MGANVPAHDLVSYPPPDVAAASPIAVVFQLDLALRHVHIDPAVEALAGIPAERFDGKTGREVGMPPAGCDRFEAACRAVIESGEPVTHRFEHRGRRFQTRLAPVREGGAITGALGVTIDLTELVRERAEARALEARYRLLTETIPQIVWTLGADGRVRYVSRQWSSTPGCRSPRRWRTAASRPSTPTTAPS